CARAGTPFDFW
nr:immunoglobulin heavy chain junction region [Mus musculus]MBK4184195.1 immunoglobulin heavy chain junction region [Mus musculus]MBK4184197.1 immunoglobulin heavy chain junction region [Mus musculus]MBK4184198.1 immunoglobulin heavy chain junction region [Mus musculus]MBK4186355.1 immunoglobulin heavy chain junction region [Mus musculus]